MKLVRKILVAVLLGTMAIQVVWADINEDFIKAAHQCDLDKVKQLLRLGADVNADNGKALINTSISLTNGTGNGRGDEKCLEVVKYLVSQGLDINAGYSDATTGYVVRNVGYKALLNATDRNLKLAKYLISKGVDVNFSVHKTYNGLLDSIMRPTHFIEGELDLIEYVISKGAFVGIDDLGRFLLKFSWGFNQKVDRDKANKVLKLFIKSVKSLNDCNHDGKQALKYTLLQLYYKKEYEVIDLLLKNGLDINFKCGDGTTMLMDAVYNLDKVKYLISKGADVNIRDDNGETALTKALNAKKYDIAEFLISKGAKK